MMFYRLGSCLCLRGKNLLCIKLSAHVENRLKFFPMLQVDGGERYASDVSEKHVTLKIAGASRTDKGLYTLKLSNPQGKDDASFFVTVTGEERRR